ncbi:conserved hypothetical protein [Culex quinquefasciatus]|uniref:Leucine-rich immune protein (Short) n=1 Tax=Culex quinquefasciatus TaxID=7176 RepID=B0X1L0_CULQU|nr:conserved hypothetical protein [Culex quinquefasciatus]|eukprot:XP_001863532.1 conserved hypothetical protein [Culex quinquefasciatus]
MDSWLGFICLLLVAQINVCRAEKIWIDPNYPKKLVIDFEDGNDPTQQLRLSYNALNKILKHLNMLKNLERLFLDDNEIEFIEMAEFNGINNLGMLALQRNKITDIQATLQNPAILPQLKEFDAAQNHLTDISFEHWNATLLSGLYLEGNKLQIAISLPGKFTGLRRVALGDNPLNCEWLQSTLKQFEERRVEISDQYNPKCNAAGPDLKEIVRRVNLKEMIAAFPLLQNRQSELENVLVNQLNDFDAFSRNVSKNLSI